MVRLAYATMLLSALGGCYDMERLDPGPAHPYLLVDDFEDAADVQDGMLAAATQFRDQWMVKSFNADNNPIQELVTRFEFVEGSASEYALLAEVRLIDPGNGRFTGVNVGVSDASPLLDARRFEAIHFAIRFDDGGTQFPPLTNFYVQLGCDSAPTLQGGPPLWVNAGIDNVSNDWQTRHVRMANFREPAEEPYEIDGGAEACLARVDSVRFTLSTIMGGLEPVTGRIYLDDIDFE
ncbi:MAG TPA: hypothetical protein VFZ53_20885 [Polyangiaceae bacterium]